MCVPACGVVCALLRRLKRLDQHFRKLGNRVDAADFVDEEGHFDDVEVFAVEVVDLLEVSVGWEHGGLC